MTESKLFIYDIFNKGISNTPLHIFHDIDLSKSKHIVFRYLRLWIEKPAVGWGVSIWQLDIEGVYAS